MTSKERLIDLAVRVEALAEPSREVDCTIGKLIGFMPPPELMTSSPWAFSPDYTASLDAAMSLVPEGLSFEVRSSGTGDKGQALIWDPMTQPGLSSHRQWRVTGCATPAMALAAASLRALAQTKGATDSE